MMFTLEAYRTVTHPCHTAGCKNECLVTDPDDLCTECLEKRALRWQAERVAEQVNSATRAWGKAFTWAAANLAAYLEGKRFREMMRGFVVGDRECFDLQPEDYNGGGMVRANMNSPKLYDSEGKLNV